VGPVFAIQMMIEVETKIEVVKGQPSNPSKAHPSINVRYWSRSHITKPLVEPTSFYKLLTPSGTKMSIFYLKIAKFQVCHAKLMAVEISNNDFGSHVTPPVSLKEEV
jgi:hypothetical protein